MIAGIWATMALLSRAWVPKPVRHEARRHEGRAVQSLEYEAHEAMAIRILTAIADEVAERFGVERLAIVHRRAECDQRRSARLLF